MSNFEMSYEVNKRFPNTCFSIKSFCCNSSHISSNEFHVTLRGKGRGGVRHHLLTQYLNCFGFQSMSLNKVFTHKDGSSSTVGCRPAERGSV